MVKKSKYSPEELAIGKVYQDLRKAKSFSQEEAAGNEISVPQLSNFENGRTIVGTHHFIVLLNNINVNMLEFQNIYNKHLQSKDILLFSTEVADAVMEQDITRLKLLSKQIDKQLRAKPNNKKLKLDKIRINSVLYFIDPSYSITTNENTFLVNYLLSISEWGLYDIRLLGQCAQFINMSTLEELTKRMIDPLQENSELIYIKRAITQNVLNIINVFVDKKKYDAARQLIEYLENSNIHEYFVLEKLTLIYNKANYSYHMGEKSALDVMEKCQHVLEFCGCSKIATQVSKELKALHENSSG